MDKKEIKNTNTENKIFEPLFNIERIENISVYEKHGGYLALKKAFKEKKSELLTEVKNANLRGRGGAGFPVGMKWGFMPEDGNIEKYLIVNADEGEPGTFKDKYIMSKTPHLLIEGMIITSYIVGIKTGYIYIRGEYENYAKILEKAIEEAREKRYLGKNILGKKHAFNIIVHRGAGAYICGEETALIESLEGKRAHPRLKPPFPANFGLYGKPTLINNVETIASIPSIINNGGFWFASLGTQKNGGTRLFGISGKVKNPGIYELPMGSNLKEIIYKYAGGIKDDKELKAVIPGGISSPVLTHEEIDISMDFDSLMKAGSMLGSGAIMVFDEDDSMVEVLRIMIDFYAHESCGQCAPCRYGTDILKKLIYSIYDKEADDEVIDMAEKTANGIIGKTICPFGDAVGMAVGTIIKKFKNEFLDYLRDKND
jgi:NADH-quinone oxidoreductase subunit F